MLQYFKRNDIGSAFALILFTFLLKAKYIWQAPPLQEIENFNRASFFFLNGLSTFYSRFPSLYITCSVIIIFLFSLYFNMVINREKLLQRKSYIPAMSILLFTSFTPQLNIFSTAFIANFILFTAFSKTLQLYNTLNPRRVCFEIGLLVSTAALFYFPSIFLFFLFLALLLLLRPFVLQENVAYLLGICTPIYVSFSLAYITNHWKGLPNYLFLHLTPPIKTMPFSPFIALTTISVTMIVYSLFLVNQQGLKNAISVRKKWNGVVIYAVFATFIGAFSKTFPGIPWIIAITPISILLSQTFLNNNEKYNTFTFYFLMAVVVVLQWLP